MDPIISVVVPVYNVEPYLRDCLESVLAQTLPDFEAICVNDGSTDGSGALLAEYAKKDARVRVITQENQGLSAARNAGLAEARGKYVYFLDSDDWIAPDTLETVSGIMDADQLQVCCFDNILEYEAGFRYSSLRGELRSAPDSGVLTGQDYLCMSTADQTFRTCAVMMAYDRAFLMEHNLQFPAGLLYEDCLFSLEVLLVAARVRHISRAFYHRRIRGGSIMTGSRTIRNLHDFYQILMKIYRRSRALPLSPAVQKAVAVQMDTMLYLMRLTNDQLKKDEWKQLEKVMRVEEFHLLAYLLEPDEGLKTKLASMEQTPDYRIGAAVLWLPRRIWRPIRRILQKHR